MLLAHMNKGEPVPRFPSVLWSGVLLAGLFSSAVAFAGPLTAATRSFEQEGHLPPQKTPNMRYVPAYARPLYQDLNKSQLSGAQRQGLADVQNILKKTPLIPKNEQQIMSEPWAQALGKKGAGIANAALAAHREKILKFLGFRPQNIDRLYYFVSFSMPLNLLREYAEQAMWDGGVLVFKGPLPHVQLSTFITKDLYKLVGGKGASATITIDPRLYAAFHVTMAPTIVYSTLPENQLCKQVHQGVLEFNKKAWNYPICNRATSKYFWKLEGAVTSHYALREFKKAGAPGISVYLTALAKGGTAADVTSTAQIPYKGSWADAPSPDQLTAIRRTVAAFGESVYKTPYGIGVGPTMKVKRGHGVQVLGGAEEPGVPGDGMTAATTGTNTVSVHGRSYTAP